MKRLISLIVFGLLFLVNTTIAQNWYQVTNGKTIGGADIAFADRQYGVVTTGLGFYTTADSGKTWNIYPQWDYIWMSFWGAEFSDNKTGWLLGYNNSNSYLVKTTDAGLTWNTISIPLPNSTMYKMSWVNNQVGFICGGTKDLMNFGDTTGTNSGLLWSTTDAGLTWSAKKIEKPLKGWRDLSMLSGGVGYLLGAYELYKTTDNWQTWNKIELPLHSGERFKSVKFISSSVGYLFGFNFDVAPYSTWVYKTIDGGQTWVLLSELKNYVIAFFNPVNIINEDNILLSGVCNSSNSTEIRRTNDGGKNWTIDYSINMNLPFQIQSIKRFGRTIWGVGDQIHKCDNLPPTIGSIKDSVALVNMLYKQPIEVVDPDGDVVTLSIAQPNFLNVQNNNITGTPTDTGTYNVWVIADDNHGGKDTLTYKLKVETTVGVEDESSIPTKYQLSQNYPNPFNPTTTISFSLAKSSDVKLIVVNSLGQAIVTLVDEFRSVGSHSVSFNASNLPSGIYFYRIIAGNFTEVKKMILVK